MKTNQKKNNPVESNQETENKLKEELQVLSERVEKLEEVIKHLVSNKQDEDSSYSPMITRQFECRKCNEICVTKIELKKLLQRIHSGKKKCTICTKLFDKNSQLEEHMTTDHQSEKVCKCDKCAKTFHFEWHLKRHRSIHDVSFSRNCHYYNNGINCPFEEIGCKFHHRQSGECYYGDKCNIRLCQYRHMKNLKGDTCLDKIAVAIQVQTDEMDDEREDIQEGKEKIDENSMVETEEGIECAHWDLQIESCKEYIDVDKSTNCEDCTKVLCSPCVQYTELHQKKQFRTHTKRRCLPCIKKKVAEISRHSNSGSMKNRDVLQPRGK